jgi:site-specific DNA-methyltransferase (adenine-specific)
MWCVKVATGAFVARRHGKIFITGNSGFPKSMDVSKAIDKKHGADAAAQWQGWGTCLKPAWEPIIVARKQLDGTVAHNVMTYGTGGINIDGCRVPTNEYIITNGVSKEVQDRQGIYGSYGEKKTGQTNGQKLGRFPANLVHDGSQEVLELFPNDSGRFFYCAKASKKDRGEGNDHPTVKPNALMRWLVRLVCPQGGIVLDPFMGSGSTGVACIQEGMRFVGIDMDEHYCDIARKRIVNEPLTVFNECMI